MRQREHDPDPEAPAVGGPEHGGPPSGEPAGRARSRAQLRRGAGGPSGDPGRGPEPFVNRRAIIILGIGALAGLLTRLACSGP